MVTREQVAAEAMTWIGTPFHHNQSCKKFGADCIGLVIGTFRNLGCLPATYYPPPYSQQWHVHQNEEVLFSELLRAGFLVSREAPLIGDLLVFQFGRVMSHVGIYVGDNNFVHAYFGLSRAVSQPLTGDLHHRMKKIMTPPWVSN